MTYMHSADAMTALLLVATWPPDFLPLLVPEAELFCFTGFLLSFLSLPLPLLVAADLVDLFTFGSLESTCVVISIVVVQALRFFCPSSDKSSFLLQFETCFDVCLSILDQLLDCIQSIIINKLRI